MSTTRSLDREAARTRSTSFQWPTIVLLALSGMLSSMQFTLVVPSLPSFSETLGVAAEDASWLVTITLLAGAVGTPVLSRMADMYGRRRMLLVALGLLVAGSLVAASGLGFAWTLAGRALQGFAASTVPIGISLLRDMMPAGRSGTAIAVMSATVGLGSATGLLLSGLLSRSFGTAGIFAFSAIGGALALCGILALVRESAPYPGGRFDVLGALGLSVMLASVLFVISKSGWWSTHPVQLTIISALGVVTAGLWFPLQLRRRNAVVDLRTAFRRPVLLTNIATFFATTGMFANHLLTAHEVQTPEGVGAGLALSPLDAGLVMIPASLAMAGLSPVAGALLNRIDGRKVLALGALVMASAFVFRLFTHGTLATIVIGAALVGMGTALSFAAMPALVMGYSPPQDAAAANGINSLIRAFSGAGTSAAFAFLLSGFAVSAEGSQFLTHTGLSVAFGLMAASCALAAVLALVLPAVRNEPERRIP
ncbi:MFS transporter [Paeniglutamicibacter sp. Y32M11]|uniref:MFS transporter n=1 Tax=Paeniglutamicibacter sp. Y32M11 TaxID=2853258 RepID=UPI001C529B5C|nr:MFS transporter [Paeniglutamicibacter sp. Y32M11]QXQ10264.1 MFS transporter [Paeniglutamicibacter sp. Y32M11]